VKLTDEVAQIRDVLGQIDSRLFKFYVTPICQRLSQIVHAGIASPTWGPTTARLTDASPFVHNVLLHLVIVHTEVSTTTGSLTTAILKHMLEQVSQCLIDAFRLREKYDLPKLMQATLDVEFLAQTLASYTTDKASEIQSNIYLVLDERTDNEARQRLQGELPALKSILKRLKDKTKGEL
jgi:exocyst complex component 2